MCRLSSQYYNNLNLLLYLVADIWHVWLQHHRQQADNIGAKTNYSASTTPAINTWLLNIIGNDWQGVLSYLSSGDPFTSSHGRLAWMYPFPMREMLRMCLRPSRILNVCTMYFTMCVLSHIQYVVEYLVFAQVATVH